METSSDLKMRILDMTKEILKNKGQTKGKTLHKKFKRNRNLFTET